ncbi:hypothetical protein [Streptomyces sp. NPDC000931]
MTGEGDRLDGLRALCAAVWADESIDPAGSSAAEALATLGW